jgi:hypothetical protein
MSYVYDDDVIRKTVTVIMRQIIGGSCGDGGEKEDDDSSEYPLLIVVLKWRLLLEQFRVTLPLLQRQWVRIAAASVVVDFLVVWVGDKGSCCRLAYCTNPMMDGCVGKDIHKASVAVSTSAVCDF